MNSNVPGAGAAGCVTAAERDYGGRVRPRAILPANAAFRDLV